MADLNSLAPWLIEGPYAGQPWTVETVDAKDSCVVVEQRHAALPGTAVMQDIWAQLHEAEHIAARQDGYSPAVMLEQGHSPYWVEWRKMCEEIRIECKAAERGVPITRARDHLDWASFPVPDGKVKRGQMYLQLANSIPDTNSTPLLEYWAKLDAKVAERDRHVLHSVVMAIQADTRLQVADSCADILVAHYPETGSKPERETAKARNARDAKAVADKEAEEKAEAKERQSGESNQTAEKLDGIIAPGPGLEGGTLDVHRHTTARHGAKSYGRLWAPTNYGSIVRYPTNLYPSGRVFGRFSAGGSILMDWSGSMSWDFNVLKDAVKQLPALYVAGYSAHAYRYSGKYTGRYCILAERGKLGDWEDELEHTGGNGGADSLALWYMLQSRNATPPYVWVSDGGVSGDGDACNAALRHPHLVRVFTLEDAVAVLTGHKAGVPTYKDVKPNYDPRGSLAHYNY